APAGGALLGAPGVGGEAVVDRRRELVLGSQPVVDGHDEHPGVLGQPRAEPVVGLEIALHPAAAVEVRDGRLRSLRGARRIDAGGNVAGGPGEAGGPHPPRLPPPPAPPTPPPPAPLPAPPPPPLPPT